MLNEKENIMNPRKGNDLISLRATKRVLKYFWNGAISDKEIRKVNELLNKLVVSVSQAIITAHIRADEKRKKYGLEPKKRLCLYKSLSAEILKELTDVNMGVSGHHNRETDMSNEAIEVV